MKKKYPNVETLPETLFDMVEQLQGLEAESLEMQDKVRARAWRKAAQYLNAAADAMLTVMYED